MCPFSFWLLALLILYMYEYNYIANKYTWSLTPNLELPGISLIWKGYIFSSVGPIHGKFLLKNLIGTNLGVISNNFKFGHIKTMPCTFFLVLGIKNVL